MYIKFGVYGAESVSSIYIEVYNVHIHRTGDTKLIIAHRLRMNLTTFIIKDNASLIEL